MAAPTVHPPVAALPKPPHLPGRLAVDLDPDIDPEYPDLEAAELTDVELSFPEARTLTLLRARLSACRIASDTDASLDVVDSVLVDLDLTGRTIDALTRVELVRCRLGGADFGDAELTDIRLDGCVLDLASMRGARLERAVISGGRVDGLDLTRAQLTDTSFAEVALGDVSLDGSRMERVDVTAAQLDGVVDMSTLRGATLSESQAVALSLRLAEAAGIAVIRSA